MDRYGVLQIVQRAPISLESAGEDPATTACYGASAYMRIGSKHSVAVRYGGLFSVVGSIKMVSLVSWRGKRMETPYEQEICTYGASYSRDRIGFDSCS